MLAGAHVTITRCAALFGLVVSATLLPIVSAATSGAAPVVTTPTSSTIVWHTCDTSFQCGKLAVPLVYGKPAAGTIKLGVIELASTSTHPEGDLLLNPGGPGASGVQFLEGTRSVFPAALRSEFNLVSFDPRGVGESGTLTCGSASELRAWAAADPAPSTPAQVNSVVAETQSFVAACNADSPRTLLDNVGTVDTVQDMDRLRAALGQSKLNYLGFSYGTYLGEVYAERYPTRIRSMVLDGAINPALSAAAAAAQQGNGFEVDLRAFFSWCSETKTCREPLLSDPSVAYRGLFARLEGGAVIDADNGPGNAGLPNLDFGLAEIGVIATLYTPSTWPTLGEGLTAALDGDGSVLSRLALGYEGLTTTGITSDLIAANTAINCEDSGALGPLSSYEALARRLESAAPDFGALEAWGTLACRYWGVAPTEHPGPVKAVGAPAILVVGATGDPATPYEWAKAVSAQFAHGVLLTRDGYGHTSYFYSSCVRTDVDHYLIALVTPPAGTVCPSD